MQHTSATTKRVPPNKAPSVQTEVIVDSIPTKLVVIDFAKGLSPVRREQIEVCFATMESSKMNFEILFISGTSPTYQKIIRDSLPHLVISLYDTEVTYPVPHLVIPYKGFLKEIVISCPQNLGRAKGLVYSSKGYFSEVTLLCAQINRALVKGEDFERAHLILCDKKDFSKKRDQLGQVMLLARPTHSILCYDVFNTPINPTSKFFQKCKEIGMYPSSGGELFIRTVYYNLLRYGF